MDAHELSHLIRTRHLIVSELMELSEAQLAAVQSGHMNELMQLLSRKQGPLARLAAVSTQLEQAIGDNPEDRGWSSVETRNQVRSQHEATEQELINLMQIENQCEQLLKMSRDRIEEQILRGDGIKKATLSYEKTGQLDGRGGSLDLSSQ